MSFSFLVFLGYKHINFNEIFPFLPNLLNESKSYMLKVERKTFVVRSLFLAMLGMWKDGYGINGMHSNLDERCVVWSKGTHE